MPVFKYKSLDINRKIKEGLVEAVNEEFAAEALEEKGYSVVSLEETGSFMAGKDFAILNRIKTKDLVIFSRQFSVLISANVAMVQSLKVTVEQTENPRLKKTISEIASEVDNGMRLSDALAKRPEIFSNFFTSVVRSGETSGKLEEVLIYLADEMEKDYDMMSKIKGAMIYPAFIMGGLAVVGTIMMIFVIPKLTDVMAESGAELPLATKILIGISNILRSYWWLIIILIGALAAFIRTFIKTPQGRRYFDIIQLRLPVFGKLFQKIYLVRFTRSLNTLIVGGVAIADSLKITAEVVSNSVYQDMIKETIKEVEDGNSLVSVFSKSHYVPVMLVQMMSVGEEAGKLDMVLAKITDFYTKEVETLVKNILTLLEPLVIVLMGLGVGLLVAAVIMPIYNLASQF